MGDLHPPHPDPLQRGPYPRHYYDRPHLGNTGGCGKTGGRKDQEREISENTVSKSFLDKENFLIFDAVAFINSLRKTLKIAGCGWESHPVIYIDKHNYELVRDYYEKLSVDRKNSAHLFVKDTANAYSIQNEWRMVIFDYGNYYSLDKTGGTNIPTSFFTQMPIFNIDELKTLQCSREFLCT